MELICVSMTKLPCHHVLRICQSFLSCLLNLLFNFDIKRHIIMREMLMNTLKRISLINFFFFNYRKRKKNFFFFYSFFFNNFHVSGTKTFLKCSLTNVLRTPINPTLIVILLRANPSKLKFGWEIAIRMVAHSDNM